MPADAVAEWRILPGGLCVFYGSGGDFHGPAFERWHGDLRRFGVRRYLGGTGPRFVIPSSIRDRGRSFFLDNRVPFATVTDDRIVRGFVTAGSWFGMKIAAFAWSDVAGATVWLGLADIQAGLAARTLNELKASVEKQLLEREALPLRRSS